MARTTPSRAMIRLAAVAVGLVVGAWLLFVSDMGPFASLFLGVLAAVLFGAAMAWALSSGPAPVAEAPVAPAPAPRSGEFVVSAPVSVLAGTANEGVVDNDAFSPEPEEIVLPGAESGPDGEDGEADLGVMIPGRAAAVSGSASSRSADLLAGAAADHGLAAQGAARTSAAAMPPAPGMAAPAPVAAPEPAAPAPLPVAAPDADKPADARAAPRAAPLRDQPSRAALRARLLGVPGVGAATDESPTDESPADESPTDGTGSDAARPAAQAQAPAQAPTRAPDPREARAALGALLRGVPGAGSYARDPGAAGGA